jgi:5-(hydroxymethyl)furfural/furfural oxidase
VEVDGEAIKAREVIVSAGAIHSPTLLLRSGIGAGALLQRCGIGIVADRPGVGQNLHNHPYFSITCHVRPEGRQHGFRSIRQPVPMIVRYSSSRPGCESTDMVINLWERLPGPLADDRLGRQMAQVMVLLNKSRSKGQVSLDASNPFGSARITSNILSHVDDVGRMVDAFRFVSRLIGSAPMSEYVDHYFIDKMAMGQPPDALTLKLLQDNARAWLLSSAASFVMDHIPGARKKVLATSGTSVKELLREPDALPALLQRICNPGGHPMGTCRMGDPSDPDAVTDSSCRVIGVGGLRVVDASIFPTPMTAGTNIPTIMAAERVAELALRERHTSPRAEVVTS